MTQKLDTEACLFLLDLADNRHGMRRDVNNHHILDVVRMLAKLSREAHRFNERCCNEDIPDEKVRKKDLSLKKRCAGLLMQLFDSVFIKSATAGAVDRIVHSSHGFDNQRGKPVGGLEPGKLYCYWPPDPRAGYGLGIGIGNGPQRAL